MWQVQTVYPWEHALLYVNGRFERDLPPGRHRLLEFGRTIYIARLPRVAFTQTVGPVDVITADQFALRLGATLTAKITDARAAAESQHQYITRLQLAAQDALVALATERPLQALLAERSQLGGILLERLGHGTAELAIESASLSSFVLPPETRRLMTEVERAKLEGHASLERARSEHAALRSLANAARLLKDNPDLMRLRTLQAVSPTGKGATLVLGSDALLATGPRA